MIRKTIASFMIFALNASAHSVEILSLKEISGELEMADETTFVIFDVDEVLITTEDHFIHPYASETLRKVVDQVSVKAISQEEKDRLAETLSLSLLLPKRVLIEEESPSLIKSLQERGVKVIALTSCPTGKFGVVPQVERWRIDHLNTYGINFASSFPDLERHFLLDKVSYVEETLAEVVPSRKKGPLFEEGILFSHGYKKGDVLKAFFEEHNLSPSKVIFIDDLQENIDNVIFELDGLNISCKGYRYKGAERFFKEPSEVVLNCQLDHLMRTKRWLSDVEIQQLLKKTAPYGTWSSPVSTEDVDQDTLYWLEERPGEEGCLSRE